MTEFEFFLKGIEKDIKENKTGKFTPEGSREYIRQYSKLLTLLYLESLKISKLNQADIISSMHVTIAAKNLFKGKEDKISKFCGVMGGLLLGIPISIFGGALFGQAQNPPASDIVIVSVLGITGSFMIAYNIAKG